jgi:hypothetical protein
MEKEYIIPKTETVHLDIKGSIMEVFPINSGQPAVREQRATTASLMTPTMMTRTKKMPLITAGVILL